MPTVAGGSEEDAGTAGTTMQAAAVAAANVSFVVDPEEFATSIHPPTDDEAVSFPSPLLMFAVMSEEF